MRIELIIFLIALHVVSEGAVGTELNIGDIFKSTKPIIIAFENDHTKFPPNSSNRLKALDHGCNIKIIDIRHPNENSSLSPFYFCEVTNPQDGTIIKGWVDYAYLMNQELVLMDSNINESTKSKKELYPGDKIKISNSINLIISKDVNNFPPEPNSKTTVLGKDTILDIFIKKTSFDGSEPRTFYFSHAKDGEGKLLGMGWIDATSILDTNYSLLFRPQKSKLIGDSISSYKLKKKIISKKKQNFWSYHKGKQSFLESAEEIAVLKGSNNYGEENVSLFLVVRNNDFIRAFFKLNQSGKLSPNLRTAWVKFDDSPTKKIACYSSYYGDAVVLHDREENFYNEQFSNFLKSLRTSKTLKLTISYNGSNSTNSYYFKPEGFSW